jgi:hypothetical protein
MMFTLTLLERSLALARRKSFSGVVAIGIGPGVSSLSFTSRVRSAQPVGSLH